MVTSTLSDLYNSAMCWNEKVWDMFGIFITTFGFASYLTDYGFDGHRCEKIFQFLGMVNLFILKLIR
jgi:NADH:ubiquinone oxidoreductase subunit C